ncbi:MAG: sigma-70 family RNA polymerase sigma factor [Deltaproteobacteria bacterium]|nr:sigma-70 family RNA polymerase sigma factor [Deltaproteobacteria bacterium]
MHLTEIYDQYYQRLRKFILHTVRNEWLADDLVQETFIRINNNLKNVRDASKLQSWIFRIAYNICQDYFRNQWKASNLYNEEISEETAPSRLPTSQKELEQGQMRKCVFGLVNHLPESLRSVIILSDVSEFNQREIAEIMGITVENVKIRLHRARKKLKALLEEHCVFEVDERNVLTCQPETPSGYNLFLKPSGS